jgi:hypothetical protein
MVDPSYLLCRQLCLMIAIMFFKLCQFCQFVNIATLLFEIATFSLLSLNEKKKL